MLECLREVLGDECFICRDLLYTIVSGTDSQYDVNSVFASFYRKYPNMTGYVNDRYFYGDNAIPILERCVLPLRERINDYREKMMQILHNAGGKYLVQTHDYLYYAFVVKSAIPDVKGVTVIC